MSIKQEAIEHYERMIKWAKEQPSEEKPCEYIMGEEIGIHWGDGLCSYFENKRGKYKDVDCTCKMRSGITCCDHIWDTMNISDTWSEWIACAEELLEYIKENG